LAAEIGEYERAVSIYEEAAKADSSDNVRRYNIKEQLLCAGLIRLAMNDLVGTRKQFDTYLSLDSMFGSSREFKFLSALLQSLEDQDLDAFGSAVDEFERINRLDDWKVSILYKAKQLIEEEPSLA
jgi:alpha-soluble NSF attachment protein